MATIKTAATKARDGENGVFRERDAREEDAREKDPREEDAREGDDWDAVDPGGSGGVPDVAGL